MATREQIEALRKLCCSTVEEIPFGWATEMWNLAAANVFKDLIELYDAVARMPDTPWNQMLCLACTNDQGVKHELTQSLYERYGIHGQHVWTRRYRTYQLSVDQSHDQPGYRAFAGAQVLYANSLKEAMEAAERVIDYDYFGRR